MVLIKIKKLFIKIKLKFLSKCCITKINYMSEASPSSNLRPTQKQNYKNSLNFDWLRLGACLL